MQRKTISADSRIASLRRARTCYDHLAGSLGVDILAGLVEHGALVRTDGGSGVEPADRAVKGRPGPPVRGQAYALGPAAAPVFDRLGVDLGGLLTRPATARPARPLLCCCVDGTEGRYHLAGALGAAVLSRAETAGWAVRPCGGRAVDVTDAGRRAFQRILRIRP